MSTPNQHPNVHSIQKQVSPQDACTHQTTGNARFWLTTVFSSLLADCMRTTSGPPHVSFRHTTADSLSGGPVVAARSGPPLGIHWPSRDKVRLCRNISISTSCVHMGCKKIQMLMENEINSHQIYVPVFYLIQINILIAFWGQKCWNFMIISSPPRHARV